MRWIATNAGHEGSIVVQKVREMKESEGFNALTDTYEDPSRPASSTPRRSSARRCRTPRRFASLLLTTEASYLRHP